jgi:hypothetical protein
MKRITIEAGLALCMAGGALALPFTAAAEESKMLYKCVDAKGITSIQSKPCPKGSTEAWARAAEETRAPTASEIAAQQAREAHNQQQVQELSAEVQRRVQEQTPPPRVEPPPGSHLAGATNPREGSQLAPVQPASAEDVPPPSAMAINNCQAAQAFASAVREKTWIGLTDDQTQRIYGWVADQCHVQTQK